MERLKWQKGSVNGWFVAHPVPGDTGYEASIHRASGRSHGPHWLWKVRAGIGVDKLRSGAETSKQAAADAANAAWQELSASSTGDPHRDFFGRRSDGDDES